MNAWWWIWSAFLPGWPMPAKAERGNPNPRWAGGGRRAQDVRRRSRRATEVPVMFKRILVPIDGSEHSTKAADKAIELARAFKSELILLHVARKYDLPDQLKDYIKAEHLTAHDMLAIDEATRRVISDVKAHAEEQGIKKIKTVFREGKPARS